MPLELPAAERERLEPSVRVMELLKTTEAFFTRTRTENFFLPQVKEILAEPVFCRG